MADNTGIEPSGVVNHMKKKGSLKIIIFGLILGVALLFIGGFVLPDGESKSNKESENEGERYDFSEYKEEIRREIEKICLSVHGVRSVSAVVCFDGVGESIYAVNLQSGNSEKTEYVVIGSGSNAHALYLGESLPRLVGIGVVCDTGGSMGVKSELATLLAATYGLPLTRVSVIEN